MGRIRQFLAAGMLLFACACQDIQGATETLSSFGPTTSASPPINAEWDKTGGKLVCKASAPSQGQFGLFQVAYACAWIQANWVASGAIPLEDQTAQNSFKVLLSEGLGLVRGNCSDFFRVRGDRQQTVNLSRDVVAIGGTTAAAIIGLTGGSALALSIIALSGATLYGSLDVYTKNFLFGADNIEAVRTLTMTTLTTNANEVITKARSDIVTFQQVTAWIMDNQEVCKPASIAAAVRVKLRGGSVDDIRAAGEDAVARAQLDSARMLQISALLGLPAGTSISETRLAAACWATTAEGSTVPANLAAIKTLLPRDPFQYGPDNPTTWPGKSTEIGSVCLQLSPAMQTILKARITEIKPKTGAATPTPASPAVPTAAIPAAPQEVPRASSPLPSGESFFKIRP